MGTHAYMHTTWVGVGGSHLAQWGACSGRFVFFKKLIFLRFGPGI